jgi:hypothetical protein
MLLTALAEPSQTWMQALAIFIAELVYTAVVLTLVEIHFFSDRSVLNKALWTTALFVFDGLAVIAYFGFSHRKQHLLKLTIDGYIPVTSDHSEEEGQRDTP